MYDLLRSLEAPAKSAVDEDRLATKLASLPLDTLIDLQSNTSLREALAYELVKEAAPFNIGQLGKQLSVYARRNPAAIAGAGVGAIGGGIAGAQDGGGLSGALGGAALGGAAGGAAGHFGGKALKGMGKTPGAAKSAPAGVAPAASAAPASVTPTPNAKFAPPSGMAPVNAKGQVQIPVASVQDAQTVMPQVQIARRGLGSAGGSSSPVSAHPIVNVGGSAPVAQVAPSPFQQKVEALRQQKQMNAPKKNLPSVQNTNQGIAAAPSSAPMTPAPAAVRQAQAPISGPAGSSSLRRADGSLISGPAGTPTMAPPVSQVASIAPPPGAPPVPVGGDLGGQVFGNTFPPTKRSRLMSTNAQGPSTAAFA